MASKYWIKMYHEALYDPKLAALADNLWRRFWELCLMAGELDEDGFLPDLDAMAWTVRTGTDALRSELGQLAMRGMVELAEDDNGQERWLVSNFAKRQAPSTAAQRMREYRKRKREEADSPPHTPPLKNKEEDTDTYRTVTAVTAPLQNVTRAGGPNGEVAGPNQDNAYTAMLAAVASVVKTTYAEHVNGQQFDDVVYTFIGYDYTPELVKGFAEWWAANGWHQGPPALKTLLNDFKQYLQDTHARPDGPIPRIRRALEEHGANLEQWDADLRELAAPFDWSDPKFALASLSGQLTRSRA